MMDAYSEERNGDVFSIVISDQDDTHYMIVMSINDVTISSHKYQKVSFKIDNIFYREVGKIHLGFYDRYVKKKKDGGADDTKRL